MDKEAKRDLALKDFYGAEARVAELEAALYRAKEALIWCSGSSDFADGGFAREGWLKLCAPILHNKEE